MRLWRRYTSRTSSARKELGGVCSKLYPLILDNLGDAACQAGRERVGTDETLENTGARLRSRGSLVLRYRLGGSGGDSVERRASRRRFNSSRSAFSFAAASWAAPPLSTEMRTTRARRVRSFSKASEISASAARTSFSSPARSALLWPS